METSEKSRNIYSLLSFWKLIVSQILECGSSSFILCGSVVNWAKHFDLAYILSGDAVKRRVIWNWTEIRNILDRKMTQCYLGSKWSPKLFEIKVLLTYLAIKQLKSVSKKLLLAYSFPPKLWTCRKSRVVLSVKLGNAITIETLLVFVFWKNSVTQLGINFYAGVFPNVVGVYKFSENFGVSNGLWKFLSITFLSSRNFWSIMQKFSTLGKGGIKRFFCFSVFGISMSLL